MSVTARLIILVVAVLVPAFAAAVWGINQAYHAQKQAAEQTLRQLAHALASVVDEELAHRAGILEALARSPALHRGDLPGFYNFARSIVPNADRTIVLSDLEGRQILNTRLPLDSARLPARSNLPELRTRLGIADDAVLVSDAYYAPVGKAYSFAVQVPVHRDGRLAYFLSMGSYGTTLQKTLLDQRLRDGWNASILDRTGVVLARRIEPERFVGKPATADMVAHLRAAREGLFETVRLDGIATLTAYAPIGSSGWTFVVSMPRAELQAGFMRAILLASGVTLALFALAVLVAVLAGRSITRLFATQHERASEQIRAANRDLERKVQAAVAQSQRAQEALLQNQKLEALGRLTGGIAHDFNNLLQTISVTMEIVLRRGMDPGVLAAAEAGKRAVQSAVTLTRQLMTFGRAPSSALETVDLRDQAIKLRGLIERALRSDIRLELDFAAALWPVTIDVVQLELALLNAALNAREAMPAGGRLVIAARNTVLGDGEQPGARAGEYVQLSVADSGRGIPADLLPRVFEPFFTTKDVGKGSGLGLAQIYGFATRAGGTAALRSDTSGGGTTLCMWLPRATTPATAAAEVVRRPLPKLAAPRTVLFVEDDELVQKVVAPALEAAGFRVLTAADAGRAAEILAERASEIALVFSDIVMPGGKSGVDLAADIRTRYPHLPVVLATGYAEVPSPPAGTRVVQKPYRMDEIAATLIAALPAEEKR
jgi:signal transduction histidine kinase